MAEETTDLKSFLEEMIAAINKKFERQNEKMAEMQKKIDALKMEMKSKKVPGISRSVLKILKE
jgi:uncharacterized coiled-coil protein SlyX